MKSKYCFYLYFLSLFGMGMFHASITPIFEGFDENAHYSWIRQIAYQVKIPERNELFLDQMIVDYTGPVRYSSGEPPFDSGMVYSKFFNETELVERYQSDYRKNPPVQYFTPSQVENWQSQHPPLYYALMAPLLRLIDHQPLVNQIFTLRMVSYLLALAGVLFGMLAIIKHCDSLQPVPASALLMGFYIYPFFLPMFYPEFSRIGNDSLCLLLIGMSAYLYAQWMRDHGGVRWSVLLGLTLGMGLLTKALFLPVVAAFFVFMLLWVVNKSKTSNDASLAFDFLLVFVTTTVIGGSWYLYNYFTVGGFSGSNVAVVMSQKGGVLANLTEEFSLLAFARGMGTSAVTFFWGGSWSLVHLPYASYVPALVALFWVALHYWLEVKKDALSHPSWMSIWLILFFVLGLSWYAIVSVALGENANTPGWYLHILMPFTAPAIGLGLRSIMQNSKFNFLVSIVLVYTLLFYLYAMWSQLSLFSGCATKGPDKQYHFSSDYLCADHAVQMIDRLSLLGFPAVAVLGLCCWIVCSIFLVREIKATGYFNGNAQMRV